MADADAYVGQVLEIRGARGADPQFVTKFPLFDDLNIFSYSKVGKPISDRHCERRFANGGLLRAVPERRRSDCADLALGVEMKDGRRLLSLGTDIRGTSESLEWIERSRLRTLYQSQKVTVAAMQMAEKKVWAQRS